MCRMYGILSLYNDILSRYYKVLSLLNEIKYVERTNIRDNQVVTT